MASWKKDLRVLKRQANRLLKLLSKRVGDGLSYEECASKLFVFYNGQRLAFPLEVQTFLLARKLIEVRDQNLVVTQPGLAALHRLSGELNGNDAVIVSAGNHAKIPKHNAEESPLMRLYCRRDKSGMRYISVHEYQAGERLRSDFERAQLQPKLTMQYEPVISKGSKNTASNTATDLSDFAVDARNRFNEAIRALEPELAGVVVDACCFLKGLEHVERERQWPARSAKLMLKTALSSLARHYGIIDDGPRTDFIKGWAAQDNRPQMSI